MARSRQLPPEGSTVRAILADILVDCGPGLHGAAAADQLCVACLPLLGVDAAAVSLIDDGESRGTFGASSELARLLDSLQFTAGEGPCLEAVRTAVPVLVPDLMAQAEPRWPAFKEAAERAGVRAVFAIPIRVGRVTLGALDLFRSEPGVLSATELSDALLVAEAAANILLAIIEESADPNAQADAIQEWENIASLSRVGVYQATGMLMAQLELSAADALMRLRAHAFAHELTAGEVAHLIIDRRLTIEP